MLKILLRKQLYELNSSFFYDRKKGKVRSKGTSILFIVLYALLMIVVIGGIFTVLAVALCGPFVGMGLDWLYFDMMTLMALFLGVFGGVFNTYSSLYKAKDNDLMLSLPIPTKYVLISRLTGVYLMGLMFSAVVMLPAVIVYFVIAKPSFSGVVGALLLTVLVSVFVFILSCLLGWVVAKISVRLKSKSLIIVILSLIFFGLYYFICFNAYELIQELIMNALTVGEKIMDSAYVLYIIGDCGQGGWLSMLYVTLAVIILFIITYRILARSFIKIATTSDKVARREYRAQTAKMRSTSSALLHRELSRFLASPTYMLNCALGTPLLILAGAALLIKGQDLVMLAGMIPFPDDFLTVMMAIGVCVIGSMNDLTASSVSLEGKSLWIAQSLPVRPQEVLSAKLRLHILLTVIPELFCSVCVCILFRPDFVTGLLCVVLPPVFTLFIAAFGLVINLKKPNLNWQTEAIAVKQSIGVLIAMLGGWAIAAVLGVGYYLLCAKLGSIAFLALAIAVLAVLAALELKWINTRGSEILRYL